jgi:hypothetical protein
MARLTLDELLEPVRPGLDAVLTFGALKYPTPTPPHAFPHASPRTHLAHAFDHLESALGHEEREEESGLPHVHHAIIRLLMAAVTQGDVMQRKETTP